MIEELKELCPKPTEIQQNKEKYVLGKTKEIIMNLRELPKTGKIYDSTNYYFSINTPGQFGDEYYIEEWAINDVFDLLKKTIIECGWNDVCITKKGYKAYSNGDYRNFEGFVLKYSKPQTNNNHPYR